MPGAVTVELVADLVIDRLAAQPDTVITTAFELTVVAFEALAEAVLDGDPQAVAVTGMVMVSEAPAARVPMLQLTVWPDLEQVPVVAVGVPTVSPLGTVSVMVVPLADAVALLELDTTIE